MQTIFVGGPGRSGTSFLADRLGRHQDVAAFKDVELKIFSEKGGLLDLHHTLTERFSPNRAGVALMQFQRLVGSLINGQFGQPAFSTLAPEADWHAIFRRFTDGLSENGLAQRRSDRQFFLQARRLIQDLSALAGALQDPKTSHRYFLEKTPHALLAPDFLDSISPGGRFIHVMRDPRSIAASLRSVRWGPDDLSACCAWVSQYCEAWLGAEAKAAKLGLRIEKLKIEEIAADQERSALSLCRALDLTSEPTLFAYASLDVLNGWADRVGEDDRRVLDEVLAGWIHHFGYDIEAIGIPAKDRIENHDIDADACASGPAASVGDRLNSGAVLQGASRSDRPKEPTDATGQTDEGGGRRSSGALESSKEPTAKETA